MIFHTTSKKPVLIVGNGARSAGVAELIYNFIDKTHIPVLTSINTVDMVQDGKKIGFIGTYGNRAANMIVAESDLIIAVGIRLGLRQIGHKKELFAPKAELIRADIDQSELSRQIKPDEIKYLIDAGDFIRRILEEDIPDYTEWYNRCMSLKNLLEGIDDTEGNKVIKKIGKLLPPNPVVSVDIGQHMCWVAQSLETRGREGRIIIGGSYGAMGVGLTYAIGAAIANNKKKVFCITGDGGLQMNIQELETVVREKLPIKILVINNHVLGKISEVQEKSYDSRYAQTTEESGYTVPSFERIAKAYGIKATTVEEYDLLNNYTSWLEDDLPCLIDINIPCDTKLIPKIEFDTMEVSPKLDWEVECQANQLLNSDNWESLVGEN